MKRYIIIASHSNMAVGLKDTLNFVSGGLDNVKAIAAYVDNKPIDDAISEALAEVKDEDELVILTDMTGGSVNQKFFPMCSRPHTHVVSGMNLPLAFGLAMEPADDYLTAEQVRFIVENAKQEIRYVNDISVDGDDEDE